jgi:hypothetical protein
MTSHNKQIIAILADEMTLPNATSKDTTNMYNYGGPTAGRQIVKCYAATAISIATAESLIFEIETYSAATAASARPPFSAVSGSPATRTFTANAHCLPLSKTSADGQLDFAINNLMWEWIIPDDQVFTDTWIQVKITTTADESSEKVNIFIEGNV